MRIGLIRHFPVKKKFMKGWVKQSEVIQWFHEYNAAPVEIMEVTSPYQWKRCYSSQLSRALETAKIIYNGEVEIMEALNEPFPSPLFKEDIKLPFLFWALVIRLAILRNHTSQIDGKNVLQTRLQISLKQILKENKDALIVSHAFTMEILTLLLLKEGFRGKRISRPKNGVVYVFEKHK